MLMAAQSTRERILQGTLRLLEDADMSAITMAMIAGEAGISRQALYLHFSKRVSLFIEAARYSDEVAGLEEAIRPVLEARTALEAIDRFAHFMATYTPRVYSVAWAAEKLRGVDNAAAAAWEDRAAQRRAGNRLLVERLHRERLLAAHWTVEEATDWLYALTSFATWGYLIHDCGWSPERYERHLRYLLRTGLIEPKGSGP